MKFVYNEDSFKLDNTVVIIGKFDCFHRGHRLLFDEAGKICNGGLKRAVVTIDSGKAEEHILSGEERRDYLKELGTDYLIEFPLNEKTGNMSPEEFAGDVIKNTIGAAYVVCGDDFCFGKDRAGNPDVLKALGNEFGFGVRVVERLEYKNEIISSTRIRKELINGNITDVNNMLGRPYSISSGIINGTKTGTRIGIPTINFRPETGKLLPPCGVYASKTALRGKTYKSITNIGKRPTFYENGELTIETNILDFEDTVYGEKATVSILGFLRDEKKFDNEEMLRQQIFADIDSAGYFYRNYGG